MAEDHNREVGKASPADSEQSQQQAGDRLVRIGGIIAAVGLVASLLALLPLVTDGIESAPWMWFVAIGGVGIGVGLALWGMVRAARARSRYFAAND